jgi:hypothetical protein
MFNYPIYIIDQCAAEIVNALRQRLATEQTP